MAEATPRGVWLTILLSLAVVGATVTLIDDVQEITDDWLKRYNEIRPHDALGRLPPARYREKLLAAAMSTLGLSA